MSEMGNVRACQPSSLYLLLYTYYFILTVCAW